VAELLVAVRQRQHEARLETRRPQGGRKPRHLGLGIRVASAIAGNPGLLWSIAREPSGPWPPPLPSTGEPAPEDSRDRLRWLPWLRRTTSWQAAYNTACLYAALASEGLAEAQQACEDRVIVSLERALNNPHSEMGRAFDLISSDPDFAALRSSPVIFARFTRFLGQLRRMDYPAFHPAPQEPVGSRD
jgi:hypothetical protein